MAQTYAVYALGCQQNWYDAEKVAHTLDKLGFFPAKIAEADLIVVLSCSVRQKAVDRLLGLINGWRKIKRRQIFVTACVLPADRTKLSGKIEHLVPDQQIHQFLKEKFGKTKIGTTKQPIGDALNFEQTTNHTFVPITLGCNNFCTFCAVPHTRGREMSRPKSLILAEVAGLIKRGKTAVTLLGQNVNSYGLSDFKPRDLRKNKDRSGTAWSVNHPSPFVELLKDVEQLKGLQSLSFLSPNPQDFSADLVAWMASSKVFSRTINLPLQSGSDRILQLMNRRYSQAEYLELVRQIRAAIPDILITTDVIVGFPSETDEDFAQTMAVVKEAGIIKVFIGIYSPRPGTTSAKLYPDDVPAAVKHQRFAQLNELLNLTPSLVDARTAGRISGD